MYQPSHPAPIQTNDSDFSGDSDSSSYFEDNGTPTPASYQDNSYRNSQLYEKLLFGSHFMEAGRKYRGIRKQIRRSPSRKKRSPKKRTRKKRTQKKRSQKKQTSKKLIETFTSGEFSYMKDDYFMEIDEFFKRFKKLQCSPEDPIINNYSTIVAVGDIHGDFKALLHILRKAKLINKYGEWTGGKTILVQVGDLLDGGGRNIKVTDRSKNDSEWRILLFLQDLRKKAKKKGGKVMILLGNHELMNFQQNFNYTAAGNNKYFKFEGNSRHNLLARGGKIAKMIACMTNGIIQIGEWVFCHAGVLPQTAEKIPSIKKLNQQIREWIINPKATMKATFNDVVLGPDSIFWTRFFGQDNMSSTDCKALQKSLRILTNHDGTQGGFIVGHTVKDNISSNCNGQLWQVDVGASDAFGPQRNRKKRTAALLIQKGKAPIIL